MRFRALILTLLVLAPGYASAEWQIKPYVGLSFGGGTTFIDFEQAAGKPNPVYGGSVVYLGDMIGIEGDFATAPGFFQAGDRHLVISSAVTTFGGNVVVALPRRRTEYTLRPYLVAGGGLMRVRIDDAAGPLVSSNQLSFDVGGGATGFLTTRLGLSWDLRYFHSIGGTGEQGGVSFERPKLSFWRASMGVVVRY